MAKLSELSIRCCYCYGLDKLHSPYHSHRTFLAKKPVNYPRLGINVETEGRKIGGAIKTCKWLQLSVPSWFIVAWASRFPSATVSGRSCPSVEGFGDVRYKAFPLKRIKELCCTSEAAAPQPRDSRMIEDAEKAVISVLLDEGLSQEDAMVIVSKAPVFMKELVDCIQDLEESGILTAEGDDRRAHIYHLASQSRGMSPFIESLGVLLSSVSKVSSSLSSQRLHEVLIKVRYIEELLIETEQKQLPLDGLVQFMINNLTVSYWDDVDLQRTLTFFEKMGRQEGGLRAINKTSEALPRILEGFPQIFKRSLEHDIKPTIRFLEDLGVSRENIGKLILCFPPILVQDSEKDLRPLKKILKKVGVSAKDMGEMVSKYPWLLTKCVGNNVEALCEYFDTIKVPKSKIDRSIASCPHLLGCSTTSMKAMVEHMNDFNLKSKRLGRAVAQSPKLLVKKPQDFSSVVSFLESVGLGPNDVNKLLRRSPEIFVTNVEGTLESKVQFLLGIGVRRKKMGRIIWFFPEVLTMSVSALTSRVNYLRGWGFTKHQVAEMVFRFPPILGYNAEAVFTPKLEFLTKVMGRSLSDVVVYPRYFSYSLEKKIKPRAKVLANHQIDCDLLTMLGKSDEEFAMEFLGLESMFLPPIRFNE